MAGTEARAEYKRLMQLIKEAKKLIDACLITLRHIPILAEYTHKTDSI